MAKRVYKGEFYETHSLRRSYQANGKGCGARTERIMPRIGPLLPAFVLG